MGSMAGAGIRAGGLGAPLHAARESFFYRNRGGGYSAKFYVAAKNNTLPNTKMMESALHWFVTWFVISTPLFERGRAANKCSNNRDAPSGQNRCPFERGNFSDGTG
jgi:hypothetical protein